MTETEAKYFKKRFLELCTEYERDCGCRVKVEFHEERPTANEPKFFKGSYSLLIDKPN